MGEIKKAKTKKKSSDLWQSCDLNNTNELNRTDSYFRKNCIHRNCTFDFEYVLRRPNVKRPELVNTKKAGGSGSDLDHPRAVSSNTMPFYLPVCMSVCLCACM